MPEQPGIAPELKLTEKHEFNWGGRVITEMRPVDGGESLFFLNGGLDLNGRKGTFVKRIENVKTIQEAYVQFDAAFEEGKAEVIKSVSGRIIVPNLGDLGAPGNNGQKPGRGRLGQL